MQENILILLLIKDVIQICNEKHTMIGFLLYRVAIFRRFSCFDYRYFVEESKFSCFTYNL